MNKGPENPFEPRLGRMRADGNIRRGRTFLSRVSRSISQAGFSGGGKGGPGARRGQSKFGRRVVVKARFVRLSMSSARALSEHLRYIGRDDAARPEDRERLFNGEHDAIDRDVFAEAAGEDRHHFRLIVSPEDGNELQNMKPLVRDLVSRMEQDLDTRLEWVAAIHNDTDHSHAHIVIRGRRDNGQDLVMTRAYVSYGIRAQAEKLVARELGPQTQLEQDTKLERKFGALRLTQTDQDLSRRMNAKGTIDLKTMTDNSRELNAVRLRALRRLGLASQISRSKWQLIEGFQGTLKALGDRSDRVKNIHRTLGQAVGRRIDAGPSFGSPADNPAAVTGQILYKGAGDGVHNQPFIILDGLEGRVMRAVIASHDTHEYLQKGMVVTLREPELGPNSLDSDIAKIAKKNGGLYSCDLHRSADPYVTSALLTQYANELTRLKQEGRVASSLTGVWTIPNNLLDKVGKGNPSDQKRAGAELYIESWVSLGGQISAEGLTWLDQAAPPSIPAYGFGGEVLQARQARRRFLFERGILENVDQRLSRQVLDKLYKAGLNQMADDITASTGKPYKQLPEFGRVAGQFSRTLQGPSGKFAVIEQGRSFTLAPWQAILERQRGQAIAGMVKGGIISWRIGRKKGLGV